MNKALEADQLDARALLSDAYLKGDARNAFNTMTRAAMLRAACRFSPALALAMAAGACFSFSGAFFPLPVPG